MCMEDLKNSHHRIKKTLFLKLVADLTKIKNATAIFIGFYFTATEFTE